LAVNDAAGPTACTYDQVENLARSKHAGNNETQIGDVRLNRRTNVTDTADSAANSTVPNTMTALPVWLTHTFNTLGDLSQTSSTCLRNSRSTDHGRVLNRRATASVNSDSRSYFAFSEYEAVSGRFLEGFRVSFVEFGGRNLGDEQRRRLTRLLGIRILEAAKLRLRFFQSLLLFR
jgi:hypothetical protein